MPLRRFFTHVWRTIICQQEENAPKIRLFHLTLSLEYQHICNLVHTPDILWPSLTHLNAPWLSMISPKQAFNVKHLTVLSEHNRSERTHKCCTGLQTLVSRNIMFDDLPMSLTRLEFPFQTTADQTAMIERLTNLKVLLIDESTSHFNISAMTNLESFRLVRPGDYTQVSRNHRFLEQIWPNKKSRGESTKWHVSFIRKKKIGYNFNQNSVLNWNSHFAVT